MGNEPLSAQTTGVWQESSVSLSNLQLPNKTQNISQETFNPETRQSWNRSSVELTVIENVFFVIEE